MKSPSDKRRQSNASTIKRINSNYFEDMNVPMTNSTKNNQNIRRKGTGTVII